MIMTSYIQPKLLAPLILLVILKIWIKCSKMIPLTIQCYGYSPRNQIKLFYLKWHHLNAKKCIIINLFKNYALNSEEIHSKYNQSVLLMIYTFKYYCLHYMINYYSNKILTQQWYQWFWLLLTFHYVFLFITSLEKLLEIYKIKKLKNYTLNSEEICSKCNQNSLLMTCTFKYYYLHRMINYYSNVLLTQ
eukprot:346382_1